ncbi:MAG: prepilin-type N-terminal cleavage/methylation domain-containing protein [Candidatus Omnitrophica bacterium]|nr:prepilin-type N-terminal cleavage/methylation domain-containing protein [Candidatus Omnitrophota bacterium]
MIKKKNSAGGFTLIELLVGIAIGAIIIALVVDGGRKIRCNAITAKCMSNIRQLGIAIMMYEQDYDALPGALSNLAPYKRSLYAEDSKRHLFSIKSAHALYYPPLGPYYQNYYEDQNEALQKVGLLHCPAVPKGQVAYGLNENVVGRSLKSITNKSCFLTSDASTYLINEIADISFRHCSENKTNIMFVDMTTRSLDAGEVDLTMLDPDSTGGASWGYWDGSYFDGGPESISPSGLITYAQIDPPDPTDPNDTGNISFLPENGPSQNVYESNNGTVDLWLIDEDAPEPIGGEPWEAWGKWTWVVTDDPPWSN